MTVDSKRLAAKFRAARQAVTTGARLAVRHAVERSEFEVVRKNFTGYSGGSGLKQLQNRSGMLRRSVGHKVTGSTLGTIVGKIGASAPYARAHEYGRPPVNSKRGKKFYTIPDKSMLTSAGVLRRPITSFRSDKSAFFLWLGGNLKFVQKKGRGAKAKLQILFHLYRFPTKPIPPRLGIRAAVKKQVPVMLSRIKEVMGGAFR